MTQIHATEKATRLFYDWLKANMQRPELRVPPNKTIEFLQGQVKELTEIAEAWMNDHDKLKAKYEPTECVESDIKRPEVSDANPLDHDCYTTESQRGFYAGYRAALDNMKAGEK